MSKGMSTLVTVVLSILVIALILFSSFGPGELKKKTNKLFFENKELIPNLDEETGTALEEHLPAITITSTDITPEIIAKEVAKELGNCWKRMRVESKNSWFGAQKVKCNPICFCLNPPCKCRTLKELEIQPIPPIVTFAKLREYLKAEEIKEIPQSYLLQGAPEALASNWEEVPYFAHPNIFSGSRKNEMYGIFENINYLICADYDWPDPDDLFITDDLSFDCD